MKVTVFGFEVDKADEKGITSSHHSYYAASLGQLHFAVRQIKWSYIALVTIRLTERRFIYCLLNVACFLSYLFVATKR